MSATVWTDEDLGLAVVWHGGATFNVRSWDRDDFFPTAGSEVDVFTVYGDGEGNPPSLEQAEDAALGYFARLAAES